MSSHTPGPWTVGEIEHHADAGSTVEINAPDPGSFYGYWQGMCVVNGRVPPDAVQGSTVDAMLNELNANARLIAAAPDLLTALDVAATALVLARDEDNTRDGVVALEATRALTVVHAAIAKARGGT